MKKVEILVVACSIVVTIILVSLAFGETKGKMDLKVGEETYTCNCGPACRCDTLSTTPGKCTCGKEMVKAKVVRVEEGKVTVMGEGWDKERTLSTVGK